MLMNLAHLAAILHQLAALQGLNYLLRLSLTILVWNQLQSSITLMMMVTAFSILRHDKGVGIGTLLVEPGFTINTKKELRRIILSQLFLVDGFGKLLSLFLSLRIW